MLELLLSLVPQAPDQGNLTAWREHLAPKAAESLWQTIPWQHTLGDGLKTAAASDRPLLLWLMNGHPLGCT